MYRSLLLLTGLFLAGFATAQDDAKAKGILDKVSAEMKTFKTISVEFTTIISTADEGSEPIRQSGKAHLKGDMYKIELGDQDIYFDGKVMVTHLKKEKEAYRGTADNMDDGMIKPNEMMTIWETGHRYKYDKETTHDGKPAHQINLYPKDPASKKYHTIILKIDKETNRVVSVLIKGKDGTNMKYLLKKLTENPDLPDSMFIFDCAKNPDVDCIDE
jgi:outer membrane lipoprotein-sorting protein